MSCTSDESPTKEFFVYDRIPPGREWRICDRAADTVAGLPGWRQRLRVFAPAEERDALAARVKQSVP